MKRAKGKKNKSMNMMGKSNEPFAKKAKKPEPDDKPHMKPGPHSSNKNVPKGAKAARVKKLTGLLI